MNKPRKEKSPSQKMRNILFLLWSQNKEEFKTFDKYYLAKMDIFITILLKKLENQMPDYEGKN